MPAGDTAEVAVTARFRYSADSAAVELYAPIIYDPFGNCGADCNRTRGIGAATVWTGPVAAGDSVVLVRRFPAVPDTVMEFEVRAQFRHARSEPLRVHTTTYNFVTTPGGPTLAEMVPVVRGAQLARRRARKGLDGLSHPELYRRSPVEASYLDEPFQHADVGVGVTRARDSTLLAYLLVPRWLTYQILPDRARLLDLMSPEGTAERYVQARRSGIPYDGLALPARAEVPPWVSPSSGWLEVPRDLVSFQVHTGDLAEQVQAAWAALITDRVRLIIQAHLDGSVPERRATPRGPSPAHPPGASR